MKKFLITLIMMNFIFCAFYPVIYATENVIEENKLEVESTEDSLVENETVVETIENEEQLNELVDTDKEENVETENKAEDQEKDNTIENDVIVSASGTYTGGVFIDSPGNGATYQVPDTQKIKLQGWAVSDDVNSVLKLYVNNSYWGDIARNITRNDVKKSYPNSVEAAENIGYSYDIKIASFPIGTHEIKVEQVAGNGQLISRAIVRINIKQKQYTGGVFIDTPANGSTYQVADTKTIKLQGWAVSDYENAILKLYVNNSYWGDIARDSERADVKKVYPGYVATTPKAGFSYDIKIASFPEAVHEIKVEQVTKNGQLISSAITRINIKQKQYEGTVFIDTPSNGSTYELPDTKTIKLQGWAVSNDEKAKLKLYVNNSYWGDIARDSERADVKKVYPSYAATTPKAGFSYDIRIASFPAGTHEIKVEQVARTGQVISRVITRINIKPKQYAGVVFIDTPSNGSTYQIQDVSTIKLQGWAVSNDENAVLKLYVNNSYWGDIARDSERADVKKAYPSYATATPKAGYSYNIKIGSFPEGINEIKVQEVSRYGQVLATAISKINISTPNYPAIIHLENPINNARYASGVLKISGWALTTSPSSSVSIYLDGVYKTGAARTKRNDVIAVYGNQFGLDSNYNAGIYSEISTAGLGEGSHNLKVILYSKYGKKIAEERIDFVISNTLTQGIDVSHHNGTINWSAVKQSGITYAILKIGEYRESSGTILVDSKFEENYTACKNVGMPVGGYFYSYEFNPTEALHEADACLKIINGKSFELPIFLDLEDDIVANAIRTKRTSVGEVTNGVATFCNIMNSRGYQSGVYSYRNFFYECLNMSALQNYNIWLAHYVGATDYSGRYDIWQYTSSGGVAGINGAVDLNWCYKRFF